MKWKGRDKSDNVDDRTRAGKKKVKRRPTRSGRSKLTRKTRSPQSHHVGKSLTSMGCLLLVLFPIGCLLGGLGVLKPGDGTKKSRTTVSGKRSKSKSTKPVPKSTEKDEKTKDQMKDFVSVLLNDSDEFWGKELKGTKYKPPKLVFYDLSTKSGCGKIRAASGPLYCVIDKTVYIAPKWLERMEKRRGIYGDFAVSFIIAHELGHHVQNLEGRSWKIIKKKRKVSKTEANELARRMELQADCYSGMFAAHARKKGWLEKGDIEEAINATDKMGDDHIRETYGGDLDPESYRHGSSKQRKIWFEKGRKSPSQKTCDTFAVKTL